MRLVNCFKVGFFVFSYKKNIIRRRLDITFCRIFPAIFERTLVGAIDL